MTIMGSLLIILSSLSWKTGIRLSLTNVGSFPANITLLDVDVVRPGPNTSGARSPREN